MATRIKFETFTVKVDIRRFGSFHYNADEVFVIKLWQWR